MKSTKCPVPNPFVVLREEFDDWAVLFNPDTSDAVGINPVGVSIWKMMDGRVGIEEMALKIGEVFANVPDTAPEEISVFIEKLHEVGFVGYVLGE